jgi:hypothetical protein
VVLLHRYVCRGAVLVIRSTSVQVVVVLVLLVVLPGSSGHYHDTFLNYEQLHALAVVDCCIILGYYHGSPNN